MNHKKVYRIMKTYNYLSTARKKNSHKQWMRATQEHTVKKNLLNREFRSWKPYEKLGTDITYLKLNWKNLYLSIVKDIISGEAISHYVSLDLSMNIVWETIKNLRLYSPTESFFWHLKDEIDISECQNVREAREYIDNYVNYYNNIRPQWEKQKMTPVQYRNFLLTQ